MKKSFFLLCYVVFGVITASSQTPAVNSAAATNTGCNCGTQQKPAVGTANTATAVIQPNAPTPHILQVLARKLENRDSVFKTVRADDLILLQLSNPKVFMDSRPVDNSKLVLYADGVALKGITSDLFGNIRKDEFKTTDTATWVTFRLKQDTTTKQAWDNLYKLADSWHNNTLHVHLSMGWEGMLPVSVTTKDLPRTRVTIVYFSSPTFLIMSLLFIGLVVLILFLAIHSDILKEEPGGAYSLSQTQLAYWTTLVIGGFLYSLLLTNIASTLNTSILLLLGISMGTSGAASYIDYFQKKKLGGAYVPKIHKGFFNDLLGDGESMNMQRFQIFAWNIVLGGYFIVFTINNKTMPVIPDVLLALAGVSSLTYVAGKPAESQ
ncbi:MAG: hypothetical protein M3N14_11120 [Bacteroidota bacterium]|nr:hypothetical protein [Bacteroidota bacterium]